MWLKNKLTHKYTGMEVHLWEGKAIFILQRTLKLQKTESLWDTKKGSYLLRMQYEFGRHKFSKNNLYQLKYAQLLWEQGCEFENGIAYRRKYELGLIKGHQGKDQGQRRPWPPWHCRPVLHWTYCTRVSHTGVDGNKKINNQAKLKNYLEIKL